jgi:DNA polymerase
VSAIEGEREERDRIIAELRAHAELRRWFGAEVYRAAAPAARPPRAPQPAPEKAEKTVSVPGEDPEKRRRLEELRQEMKDCHHCPLAESRTHLVFGEGRADARLMFVGEAPGRDEDRTGRPFVGRAGKVLTRMIEAMGLQREDVFIGNILKCRPPGNRNPSVVEMAECMPYILKQIKIVEPEVICALGTTALKGLLHDPNAVISRMRGRFLDWRGTKLMPTYHPAYLLRSPGEKRKVWEDLQKIMAELGLPPPES